jgi:hypothetical protein
METLATVDGTTVESAVADLLGRCNSRAAVGKNRADAVEELGDEDGGVALHLGTVDPLLSAGRICTGEGARCGRE